MNHHLDTTHRPDRSTRRRPARRAGAVAALVGLGLAGPLASVAAADTPAFPGDGPVIVLPEPTIPPVVVPGDIVLPEPTIPPFVGPGDIVLPDPVDPDPGPFDGPGDVTLPEPGDEPDPGPFDGPDDLTADTTVPPTTTPEPQPEPEVESETEQAPTTEAAAEELAFTGGSTSLALVGAGLAAAGALGVGGAAIARRRRTVGA